MIFRLATARPQNSLQVARLASRRFCFGETGLLCLSMVARERTPRCGCGCRLRASQASAVCSEPASVCLRALARGSRPQCKWCRTIARRRRRRRLPHICEKFALRISGAETLDASGITACSCAARSLSSCPPASCCLPRAHEHVASGGRDTRYALKLKHKQRRRSGKDASKSESSIDSSGSAWRKQRFALGGLLIPAYSTCHAQTLCR